MHINISKKSLIIWLLTLLLLILTNCSGVYAQVNLTNTENISMPVQDLKDLRIYGEQMAWSSNKYETEYEKVSKELKIEQDNRIKDKYLYFGVGVLAGVVMAKVI